MRRPRTPICRLIALLLVVVCLFVTMKPACALAQDMARGLRNYQDVMKGKKTLEGLSKVEQNEVIQVYMLMQSGVDDRKGSSDCRDARSRARSAASDLASAAGRLKSCAESSDFSNDCSSEARRVKSAQSDYESATSSVGSYCR